MRKETIVSTNFECDVFNIKNEAHLRIKIKGISEKNYSGNKTSYANQKQIDLIFPFWAIPYLMRLQRKEIAKWEKQELEFLKRIKDAFNTEVKLEDKV